MLSNLFGTKYFLVTKRIFTERAYKDSSKFYLLFLITLSSSCFYLSWTSYWFGGLLFVAVVPILAMIKLLNLPSRPKWLYVVAIFLTLVLWNTATIWWIYKAALPACIFVVCYNTLCLAFPCFFYYWVRKWSGIYLGYMGLVTSWLTLEYAHLQWDYWELTFPWLNLGNGLAALPQWIQWYAYTGTLGGSFWILTVNILLYHLLFEQKSSLLFKFFIGWLLLPIAISLAIYNAYREQGPALEAVVVQPNFDSYTEKCIYSRHFVPYSRQIDRLLTLSKRALSPATALVVWPESAIDANLNEEQLDKYLLMSPVFELLKTHPDLHLIIGLTSNRLYGSTKITKTAQKVNGMYVDHFNSLVYLKRGQVVDIYHKMKLLPGGECIPYLNTLPGVVSEWIRNQIMHIGYINPCFAASKRTTIFQIDKHVKVAPIICYELLYGALAGNRVTEGANLLAIVTNDGWWGDTPIYHQFFQYSRLLAIAHRRSIMRAANTGISGFINQRGDVISATNRLEVAATSSVVSANTAVTFYSSHGDYIGYIAQWICLILFGIVLTRRWRKHQLMAS